MDFRPEKLYLGEHANGKPLRIEEWSFDTRAGVELMGSLVNLFTVILFAQIISPFILVFIILGYNGRFSIYNLIGLIVGSYFLIDAYNGWIITTILKIFLSEGVMNVLIYLNAIAVILHAFILVFGPLMHTLLVKNVNNEKVSINIFLMTLALIGVFTWMQTNEIIKVNPGWVERNVKACFERNADPEPEYQKSTFQEDSNDGSFHDDPNYETNMDTYYNEKPGGEEKAEKK